MLYIHNATLLSPTEAIPDGALLVAEDRIASIGTLHSLPCPPEALRFDAQGLFLTPGFIDLQINGGFGLDFTDDPTTIWEVGTRLVGFGVTAFLPTIVTSPVGKIEQAQRVMKQGAPEGYHGAQPLGLHLEGPFLNPKKRGAHNPVYLRQPDATITVGWRPENGVRLVTLAPELPGALELVHQLSQNGVIVSAGHSMASYEQALAGFETGIRYGTHLFNAMLPLEHRAPGLVGALLSDPRPVFGVIADGLHLHPAVLALAWRLAGEGRLNLVTDAMAALGMPPGEYPLNDMLVKVDGKSARLPDGTLAGSLLSLDQAVRNLVDFTGCSPLEAVTTVTRLPARLLGMENERGSLLPGSRADLVILTTDLQVKATLVGGELVYNL